MPGGAAETATGDAWYTLAEAAAFLGCSVDTVRRRLRAGVLVGEQRATPRGVVWYVRLGMPGSTAQDAQQPAEHAPHAEDASGELIHLVRDQQHQLLQLAGQVGYLQRQVQEQAEQVKALTAGDAHQTRGEGQQAAALLEVDSVPIRRPWWRVWR